MTENPAKALLHDDDIRRWYENMYRASPLSASVGLRRLNLFCDRTKTTPQQLISICNENTKRIEDLMLDHVTWMEGQEYSPGYIVAMLKSIKSWLVYNRIEIRRKIRITNSGTCPNIANEKVPDQKQLRQILAAANTRCRVAISMMAFSGVRPQVLGKHDAKDGLRLGDIEDLIIKGKGVSLKNIPAMITIRASLSKTRNKYVTFLSEEGCEHLLGYLRYRVSNGEELTSDSPVILANYKRRGYGWRKTNPVERPFLCTVAISCNIRDVMRTVIKARPYTLRAYFDTQLLVAESNGCMTHSYRQFFMGHKGDMEARYTVNKGRLTEQMISDMRRAYKNSQMFLSTDPRDVSHDKKEMLLDLWRQQAKTCGVDIDSMISSEKAAPAKEPEADSPQEPEHPVQQKESKTTDFKIVKVGDELVSACTKGWEIVKDLGQDRFLLRMPA